MQVALISFCQMWAKYKFAPSYNAGMEFQDFKTYAPGDYVFHDGKLYECRAESDISSLWENKDWMLVKTYRTDLSFTVFFKPRLSECVRRELNIIKYSLSFNFLINGYKCIKNNSSNKSSILNITSS